MTTADQWDLWRRALAGEVIVDYPRDEPPSGFWRQGTTRGQEAIAIWRDGEGQIKYRRSIFERGVGESMFTTGAEIGELFSASFRYPIPHELYLAVTKDNKPWPPEYTTRLTVKELQANVPWTLELARQKLGEDIERIQAQELTEEDISRTRELRLYNPRAVIGDNEPPPAAALSARVKALIEGVAKWLRVVGGKPRTKAEADTLANYATKFGNFTTEANMEHKAEKEPFLTKGREVDARWFPIRDEAMAARKRCLAIVDEWMNAENARQAEEARIANEVALKMAQSQAKATGEKIAPIVEVVPEKVTVGTTRTVSQRTRTVWVIHDIKAYGAHLASLDPPPADFVEVCEKIANRMKVQAPGIKSEERKSAS